MIVDFLIKLIGRKPLKIDYASPIITPVLTNLMSTLNDHSFKNNHLLTNKTIGDRMSSIGKVYILLKAFKYQESRKVHQSDGIVNYLPCFWS